MAMDNTRIYQDRRFKFLGACALAALALVWLRPESTPAEAKTTEIAAPAAPIIDVTRDDLYLIDHPSIEPATSLTLKYGDSLGPMLQKNGLEPGEAYKLSESFSDVYDPRKLKVGQNFNLFYDQGQISYLTYKPSVETTVYVNRNDDGSYNSRSITAEFKMETVSVKTSIENSIYLDANRLGAPDKVIQQFANIYEYSVDFQRDIQPGDEFEMFFEVAKDSRGEIVKAGDLLYTSFSPRGKKMDYYLFTDAKGRENFYDADGKTAKRKLRATPVNGARLSSSYGRRKHPISGYRKMHTGVDFAAPSGTPILAAGTGTIEFAGTNGGYGKYIRIRHSDGYKTAYAHMSRFARGMGKGKYVSQDQIIGYVGTTGYSTGPHLHYEVHHNGQKINPRRLSQLSGKPLSSDQIPAFKSRRAKIDKMRSLSPVLQPEPILNAELTVTGKSDAPLID
ncbi:MAG: M23 family metallopeptidase [Hellea sp.]|nr:M23 family metallopeptidase [Hellea sp.]